MKIHFTFEYPHTDWSTLHVYARYYTWFINNHNTIESTYQNSSLASDRNVCGPYSPHIMTVRNLESLKYYLVSYWDNAASLMTSYHDWDPENCVGLITSSGVYNNLDHIPFSYTCYGTNFENLSLENIVKKIEEKPNSELKFRGYLYGERLSMSTYYPEIFLNHIGFDSNFYFQELNNSKICLSLNGVGEICNRDMEILSVGSVLLRPELTQVFHDPLIPDFHYLSVQKVNDPKEQIDLLIKKYKENIDNLDFLNYIGSNGYNWFKQNGTIDSNVEILKKIIDLNKLF